MNQAQTPSQLPVGGAQRRLIGRLALIAAEALLVLLVIGLLLATWMPAIIGPTDQSQPPDRSRPQQTR